MSWKGIVTFLKAVGPTVVQVWQKSQKPEKPRRKAR